jgi:hypothetical protein
MDLQTQNWKEELKVLSVLSWPVICTNLLAYTIQVVGQASVDPSFLSENSKVTFSNRHLLANWAPTILRRLLWETRTSI